MVKIDRTCVRDIGVDEADRAIIASMVNVAKAFGLRIVAEGIETDAQAEFVGALGCDEGQGFRFGAPQSSRRLESLLRARTAAQTPYRPAHGVVLALRSRQTARGENERVEDAAARSVVGVARRLGVPLTASQNGESNVASSASITPSRVRPTTRNSCAQRSTL